MGSEAAAVALLHASMRFSSEGDGGFKHALEHLHRHLSGTLSLEGG